MNGNKAILKMLQRKFNCSTPKDWQVDLIHHMVGTKNVVVILSRRTGEGKTLAIQGSAMALRGVTLLLTPTVLLSSFMNEEFRKYDYDSVINLDGV